MKAPCFATIAPRFVALQPGRCEARVRDCGARFSRRL
ncbi:MAG TPA: hypothetical protein VIM06_02880 [Rhodanobacter sp.]